jgi:hypothetical protein
VLHPPSLATHTIWMMGPRLFCICCRPTPTATTTQRLWFLRTTIIMTSVTRMTTKERRPTTTALFSTFTQHALSLLSPSR